MQWLDNASSLDGNGVNEGDLLLLRKKFFILNDDITEAVQGNKELKELLYHQVTTLNCSSLLVCCIIAAV